jgi:hypothetical protein
MTFEQSNKTIVDARAVVLAWVRAMRPCEDPTNEELARCFCALLPEDVALDLRTNRNPSALVYEARWYHHGKEVAEFPKPFCAEIKGDAEVLACSAMIALSD